LQRHLVHDRRAIDQPADRAHVGPGQRRIVEDRGIFHVAAVQALKQLIARHAKRLGGAIEVKAVARLVLHLGQQDRLAFQRRRAGDPVAFRQLADDLGMRMLADLADQRLAVAFRHPLLRLDLLAAVDAFLKRDVLRRHLGGGLPFRFHQLCIHGSVLLVQTHAMMITMPCPAPMHIVRSVRNRWVHVFCCGAASANCARSDPTGVPNESQMIACGNETSQSLTDRSVYIPSKLD
jgi:hypothetical protein